jgi:hypothetical protein
MDRHRWAFPADALEEAVLAVKCRAIYASLDRIRWGAG